MAEHRARARAGAVHRLGAVLQRAFHQVEILTHRGSLAGPRARAKRVEAARSRRI
ncbi:hypothetical protein PIB19_13555 [Sphingomonas sp. 7/4-4]|uniref:hypothetical protein n=1 Tax=Sphingomonas sp. 7/4-4 TaxID=3018446 RepID=UPI0022F3D337|nr:hypothetical protein [Sphingomonas sp. 7/4-4]WBY09984.1 hypothetical protein PIB19_13555 [Sphingomonas sp. 7/4-4]